jgi:two-component system cell cycle response regulator CtrA
MHVLVVEDVQATARSIELKLKAEGHTAYSTNSGEDAIELADLYEYDLVLLDLDLPDMSGFDVIKAMRRKKINAPIMVLTATADVEAKVQAFGAGADDYLTKPFHKDEMSARINAIVRRSRGHGESVIRTGPIALNIDTRIAEVNGTAIKLTPTEYKVLELLSLRKNSVLTKEMCLNYLYNGLSEPEIKIIDVFICKLRKKIAAASGDGNGVIETVWGGGYMLRDQREKEPVAKAA